MFEDVNLLHEVGHREVLGSANLAGFERSLDVMARGIRASQTLLK
jgi:hypothetical protein